MHFKAQDVSRHFSKLPSEAQKYTKCIINVTHGMYARCLAQIEPEFWCIYLSKILNDIGYPINLSDLETPFQIPF